MHGESRLERVNGLAEQAELKQGMAQVVVANGVGRLLLDEFAIGVGRIGEPPVRFKASTKLQPCLFRTRLDGNQSPEQVCRGAMVTFRHHQLPERVQRRIAIRPRLQDLPVSGFRSIQPPGLMQLDRTLQCLRNASVVQRVAEVPSVSSFIPSF